MTQEDYNNLTDEEKNALTEVHVLGGRIEERENVCRFLYSVNGNQLGMQEWFSGEWVYDVDPDYFHSLDRAFMGAEPYHAQINQYHAGWVVSLFAKEFGELLAKAKHEKLTEAIMLACLRAKGVVE